MTHRYTSPVFTGRDSKASVEWLERVLRRHDCDASGWCKGLMPAAQSSQTINGSITVIIIIIIITTTMFMVLSSWHCHCDRLSAGWTPTLRPNQPIWTVSPPKDWLLPSTDTIANTLLQQNVVIKTTILLAKTNLLNSHNFVMIISS